MRSLRTRILMLVAGFGLSMAVVLALIMHGAISDFYSDLSFQRASLFARRITEMHPDLWRTYESEPSGFGDRLRQYILYSPNIGLYLVDNDGRILSTAGENRIFWSNYRVDLTRVASSLAVDPRVPIIGDDPDREGATCLVSAVPVFEGGQRRGWLYVVPRVTNLAAQTPELFRSYAIQTAIKVGLLTLAVGVMLTLATIAMITRPLTRLTRAADRIKNSGFSAEIDECDFETCSRDDEIGRLSRTLRDMFERLKIEIQRVTETDARRREMVASVSHDLRTPLTALIGQLETIRIKGEQLCREDSARFHDRALQNAQHLRTLTDSLAELAKLDSPEFTVQAEPLQIGELTDDVVQRFAPRAEARRIRLSVDYPDGLPLTAVDAALIDRALSNLLDNALRVTPDEGEIRVGVVRDAAGLRVEVSDSGPGVAIDDQASVFERFYQASKHRETRGSSGLGLAIVRRVAELHGGRAGLHSRPGEGATFYIELPTG